MKNVSPKELDLLLHDNNQDELLVDVRTPPEYQSAHLIGAVNIPIQTIEEEKNIERLRKVGIVYVMCGSGARSARACQILSARGIAVMNLSGGLRAWQNSGFHVVGSGKIRIPIIRQVMITAGVLILLGAGLGYFVHLYWFALSAFVGAGLLFAGVSGICTMSWVLSKMPWNT
ncbi:MAG: rhodanese-like domain-containing protein [Candidatus Pacebacteria bacterium]|nr:rhodanese-like domain-containing protein [Candidatus Paceibacterota bacterium]